MCLKNGKTFIQHFNNMTYFLINLILLRKKSLKCYLIGLLMELSIACTWLHSCVLDTIKQKDTLLSTLESSQNRYSSSKQGNYCKLSALINTTVLTKSKTSTQSNLGKKENSKSALTHAAWFQKTWLRAVREREDRQTYRHTYNESEIRWGSPVTATQNPKFLNTAQGEGLICLWRRSLYSSSHRSEMSRRKKLQLLILAHTDQSFINIYVWASEQSFANPF